MSKKTLQVLVLGLAALALMGAGAALGTNRVMSRRDD